MMPTRLLPLAYLFSAAALLAQNGDRQGETQTDVPSHIIVPPAPVLTPEEALTTLKTVPGVRVELAAADPLVHDPIAMVFGPDGRMWVVEMRGYMPNVDGKGEDAKVGSIAVLEDTNGDGRADKRTVFLDGLVMPRALALVGDGLLVAEPPHLWFCRNTNGDGVADSKIEVASDYGSQASPEHTANGLLWALDNWIYSANHTQRYRYLGEGRFTSEITPTRGQWGITQDDAGRLYYNSNSDPLRVDLIPSAYLRRNPSLTGAAGTNVQLAPNKLPIWPARVTPGVNRGYQTLNAEGKITAVTAAGGPVIYRSSLFPADFYGNAFITEPSGNLVKRLLLTETNGTLKGSNAYEGTEFLTSTDERFRPVNLVSGPDGALYVVDMYRGILQHRIYVTSYLRKQILERKLDEGLGYGRIYRLSPENSSRSPEKFNLATETTPQLIAHLSAANSWWRDTAQRLLVERRDPTAASLLRELVRSGQPLAQVHALWILDGTDQLDRDTVLAALNNSDPRVASTAIRLSEKWLAKGDDPELLARVLQGDATNSPALTLQLALSLGTSPSSDALAALAVIAGRAGQQPFIADAIVTGIAGREPEFIKLVATHPTDSFASSAVALAANAVFKSRDVTRITALLTTLEPKTAAPSWIRQAVLNGLERFLPKTPEGKSVAGMLSVEPKAVIALATQKNTPEGKQAARLIELLRWPGKPGLAEELAAATNNLKPAQKALFEKGRVIFSTLCAACHQPNGEGLPGLAPQLVYSRFVLGNERQLARIVLNGKEKDGLAMPPLSALDDESLAAALTYVRMSWGHNAPPVSPATIAAVRAKVSNREKPWSEDELELVK